ncbi:hypothetical protein KIN20_010786 [Parelaphostrongylus tenuis]|uniref:SAM domain-containing protein n=2 Tax=Parelaphostrongylus tenuis TaxID=148309 RepID=A0AAD5MUG6_PARTN|nr:hypothetical protein KIN20_010786 [Parelaphostrongylus tenuis]
MQWLTGHSSPSPSMSTVSCPEYPELQERLHRLAIARDSLSLQVSVLSEQVGAQKEKIRDLEALLALKRNSLSSAEELRQDKHHCCDDIIDLESKNLMFEVSELKNKFANLEQGMNESEKNVRVSQVCFNFGNFYQAITLNDYYFHNDIDCVNQSMRGVAVPEQICPNVSEGCEKPYASASQRNLDEYENEEMKRLRNTVQRLIADNEQKNHQIHSLRNALNEQLRSRSHQEDIYRISQWNNDLNSQIRRLLLDEPSEMMTHSTSFPVRLCSTYRQETIQPSPSFTSSLPTPSSSHGFSRVGVRHLYPSISGSHSEQSYRSPSSLAARQLAAELDELRQVNFGTQQPRTYSSVSLPRRLGNKASSTLALGSKKHSFTSVNSAVESDDEITRGAQRTVSPRSFDEMPPKRSRTRSSIRSLFNKLTRSLSQEQNASIFKAGSAVRSTLGDQTPGKGRNVELFPPLSNFVDWRSEQLAEWLQKAGLAQYVFEITRNVPSGRHLLNMSSSEFETVLGMKNALLRKRLNLLLRRIEDEIDDHANLWDVQQTQKWLEDIGLPQYKEVFCENMIDGIMILALTAADLAEMRVLNAHHYLCISRSIQYMKAVGFKAECLLQNFDESVLSSYPRPEVAVRWTHAATCEWLRMIDLAEFTTHLLCAGTPGALMVCEPTFTAETLAEILQIPSHKTLLRRHLTTHFNQLLGQRIVAEKRDFLASGVFPLLLPGMRIKIARKGQSLSRKKSKTELYLEPNELLCSPVLKTHVPCHTSKITYLFTYQYVKPSFNVGTISSFFGIYTRTRAE